MALTRRSPSSDSPRKRAHCLEDSGQSATLIGEPSASAPVHTKRRLGDDQIATLMSLFDSDAQPTTGQKQAIARDMGVDLSTITTWYRKRRKALTKRCPVDANGKPLYDSPSPEQALSPSHLAKGKRITIDDLAESAQRIRVVRTHHKRRSNRGRRITLEWACEQQAQRREQDAWSPTPHVSDGDDSAGGPSISVDDAYETRPPSTRPRFITPPQSETASEAALCLLSLSGSAVIFPSTS